MSQHAAVITRIPQLFISKLDPTFTFANQLKETFGDRLYNVYLHLQFDKTHVHDVIPLDVLTFIDLL